jgi:hypothetical protein
MAVISFSPPNAVVLHFPVRVRLRRCSWIASSTRFRRHHRLNSRLARVAGEEAVRAVARALHSFTRYPETATLFDGEK